MFLTITAMALLLMSGCTNTSDSSNNTADAQQFPVKIIVMLADENKLVEENITVNAKTSAYDALIKVATVESKQFGLGKFITTIEGVKPAANEYWAFYIDGNYAQVGADSFKIEKETELIFQIQSMQ